MLHGDCAVVARRAWLPVVAEELEPLERDMHDGAFVFDHGRILVGIRCKAVDVESRIQKYVSIYSVYERRKEYRRGMRNEPANGFDLRVQKTRIHERNSPLPVLVPSVVPSHVRDRDSLFAIDGHIFCTQIESFGVRFDTRDWEPSRIPEIGRINFDRPPCPRTVRD